MKKRKIVSVIIIFSLAVNMLGMPLISVTCFALSAGGIHTTIASVIISLMLQCGVAPTNQAWLDTLNASYGVESSIGTIQDCIEAGLLTQSGSTLIDTGLSTAIESQAAYTELGLAEIFTTSADDVAMGVSAASGGVNLANTAINCGTAGTIGAFAGAVGVGVGLGVLANKLITKFSDYIKYGAPISFNEMMTTSPMGGQLWFGITRNYKSFRSIPEENNTIGICYKNDDGISITYFVWNIGENNILRYNDRDYNNSNQLTLDRDSTANVIPGDRISNGYWEYISRVPDFKKFTNYKYFESFQEAENYVAGIMNGTIQYEGVISPDLIGSLGNYTNPEKIKSVVPEGYDMNPVDMEDYQNYVDGANNNTDNNDTGEEVQGTMFDNLIDSLLVEPSLIPDQGVTDPDVPDRPIIPDQPDTPAKDPISGEDQSQVLEGITTPDLRSVFPFCIPFDLYALLGNLKYESREAPVIVWEFEFMGNSYPIIIDLSPYDEAAEILRLCELLLFIVGLAVATRRLIGAGG